MNAPPDSLGTTPAEFVSFVTGDQGYCIEVVKVREIRRWSLVTPLPFAPAYYLGVMNLRGAVIPIIDLALRLGLASTVPTPRHVVLIVTTGERTIGLLVDSVSQILKVPSDALRGVPVLPSDDAQLIRGIVALDGAALRILDTDAVAPLLTEVAA